MVDRVGQERKRDVRWMMLFRKKKTCLQAKCEDYIPRFRANESHLLPGFRLMV